MPDNKPAAVFFDLDGTIIDTAPDMGGALNRLLIRHERPQVCEQDYRPHVSHGSIALLKLGFTELQNASKTNPQLLTLRDEFLNEYETHVAAESRLFDGIEQIFERLETRGIPWGVITNKPEYLTIKLLDELDITRRCCCIVGADTAARAKPHPEPMELACRTTGVTAQACLYVGDAERDIQAGRAVGMTSLIAGWGYIDPITDDTNSWGAHALLSTPAELNAYF
ncbi:MAG: HAD-IA family hydrolase [Pseudomonadota bacterium]